MTDVRRAAANASIIPGRSGVTTIGIIATITFALAGCSFSDTIDGPDAFTVNGSGMSADRFETLAADAIDSGIFSISGASLGGDDARELLSAAVQLEAFHQFLPRVDERITAADTEAGREQSPQLAQLQGELGDFLGEYVTIDPVLARVQIPSSTTLRKWYEESPVLAGSLCIRHILVGSDSEARAILDRLKEGMSFAEASRRYSTDESVADQGGALEGELGPCIPNRELFSGTFDAEFVAAAIDAKVGVPTGPVQTAFGWHILLNRPWSEVSTSVRTTLTANTGANLLIGYLARSNVTIDGEYGRWLRGGLRIIGR